MTMIAAVWISYKYMD